MSRARSMQFERHMSDNEALMWNLEKDPALSSWFASVTVLDTAPSMERLRARLARAVTNIPRLRQRVAPGLGRLAPPMWVDDAEFDLDFHVRRLALPSPGDEAELHRLATTLLLDPFERSRPLWQFVVIEGLEGGRAALFQKMHHTITDGEGGLRLAEQFVDLERDADGPDPAPEPVADPAAGDRDVGGSTREVLGHNVRRFGGLVGRVARSVTTDPAGTANGVGAVLAELRKALFPATAPAEVVGSPLWRPRTLKRWYGTLSLSLDDVKAAGRARDGTVNDVFVAGALAGAAAYHADRDVVPNTFRIAMPVSTRSGGSAGGNAFAITTTDLVVPVDPEQAFDVVRAGLADARAGTSVDVLGSLSMIINLLPTSVLTGFAKDTAATVDFTVSNVRGAPVELYIAGARCEAVYPMGPISGTAFNLTTLSYAGRMDMGLVVDAGAVEDPPALRDALIGAYDRLLSGA